jgi:succinate dehydrogenase/fumarate reductase flavoprotein subunit
LSKVSKNIDNYFSKDGQSVGEFSSKVTNLGKNIRNNSEKNISNAKELQEVKISLTDQSRVMNTELITAIQIKSMVPIIEAISQSG